MPVMADGDRQALWTKLMREAPAGTNFTIDKYQLRACVNAADSVASSNAGALNNAIQALEGTWNTLPQGVRAYLFAQVILERWVKGA
jgi:hypothetical protein